MNEPDKQMVVMANVMLDSICEYLRMRANDPWDDSLWPAANAVLMAMANELECDEFRACEIADAFGCPFPFTLRHASVLDGLAEDSSE